MNESLKFQWLLDLFMIVTPSGFGNWFHYLIVVDIEYCINLFLMQKMLKFNSFQGNLDF